MRHLAALAACLSLTAFGQEAASASIPEVRVTRSVDVEAIVSEQMELEVHAERTVTALDALIRLGCYYAAREGHPEACDEILTSWDGYWKGQFYVHFASVSKDMGDHAPYSEYLAKVTAILHDVLGDFLFEALHLDDLYIFNYGLPVMFSPHSDAEWCLEEPQTPCREEYVVHTNPTLGVTSYWVTWAACTGATWGMGAVSFVCSPVGTLAERITLRTWGPKLSLRIWDKNNE